VTRLVNQRFVTFGVISDHILEASKQHPARPLSHQLIKRGYQVVALGVLRHCLQRQAYSFPAGCNQRIPSIRSGRVRRPSLRIPSSTTFGYSSTANVRPSKLIREHFKCKTADTNTLAHYAENWLTRRVQQEVRRTDGKTQDPFLIAVQNPTKEID